MELTKGTVIKCDLWIFVLILLFLPSLLGVNSSGSLSRVHFFPDFFSHYSFRLTKSLHSSSAFPGFRHLFSRWKTQINGIIKEVRNDVIRTLKMCGFVEFSKTFQELFCLDIVVWKFSVISMFLDRFQRFRIIQFGTLWKFKIFWFDFPTYLPKLKIKIYEIFMSLFMRKFWT